MPERRMIITAPVHGQDNIDVEGCYSVHRASAVLPLVGLTCDGVGRDKQKTDSRFDKVPALLRHRALCARVAPLLHRYPTHEAHSGSRPFSVKERTPMPFRNLTMDYPLAGRVMSAVYPPSCGASIGGVPRFTCEVV